MGIKPDISFHILFLVVFLVKSGSTENHPDTNLTIVELIQKYGYPVETHDINTEDGYILTMIRIPHGRNGKGVNAKPVLLMHGLFSQSISFIISGMNNGSLAYAMADDGYDVWLGNSRGTAFGQRHVILDPKDKQFWNFSWHEIGLYDIPAEIDYILEKTGKCKLHYVGYSQGGTTFYVMASLKPEYQKKIALASLLGAIGFLKNFSSPAMLPIMAVQKDLFVFLEYTNTFIFPPFFEQLKKTLLNNCEDGPFLMRVQCQVMYSTLFGNESPFFNPKMLSLIINAMEAASYRQVEHYAQNARSGKFREYDYGEERNLKIYGQPEPPAYPVWNIETPVAMYTGLKDNSATPKDISDMCNTIKNCVRNYILPFENWVHLDFAYGVNTGTALNEPIIALADKYDINCT